VGHVLILPCVQELSSSNVGVIVVQAQGDVALVNLLIISLSFAKVDSVEVDSLSLEFAGRRRTPRFRWNPKP
jgi:hypothetical protein